MEATLPKTYQPAEHEPRIRRLWEETNAFHADPKRVTEGGARPYAIVIPPPNVTAALHLGHALNNTLQDVLVRAHRMMGFETVWLPGTDHAGIATQTVVDKRLRAEGKPALAEHKQMELAGEEGREKFVELVKAWKDEYEERISQQLKEMGCSCDWARRRFTMDEVCARAVRESFFQLFKHGLIYRGKRLVNWDPVTHTALADDEVEMVEVQGHFWYLRYPICDADGNPASAKLDDGSTLDHVTVATTRPETYLGDTAVAVNPKDPRAGSLRGLYCKLPFVNRVIPIIEDDYVVLPAEDPDAPGVDPKAKYASGFLKVTPAHDPNDWLIGERHGLEQINVMAEDASISDQHGWADVGDAGRFIGMSREDARKGIVDAFDEAGLLAEVKDYTHSVGHSYRSHSPIEPYLSDQWYVKVTDPRLAGSAQRAIKESQRQTDTNRPRPGITGDGAMTFYPERYAQTYESWHDNIRDWCISRQLWWGHRISVWSIRISHATQRAQHESREEASERNLSNRAAQIEEYFKRLGCSDQVIVRRSEEPQEGQTVFHVCSKSEQADLGLRMLESWIPNFRPPNHEMAQEIKAQIGDDAWRAMSSLPSFINSCEQDPDVLDTWYSSALWPLSTMGWPDPGQAPEFGGMLDAFNPTNVLSTARDIITLWVSRMVMFNRFFYGENQHDPDAFVPGQIPFHDVFIHAMIQDGEGRKMSKTLGNGVDPLDIIHSHGADAMRFTLCQMATQTQDVRLPVELDQETGRNTSPKFDLGKRFCNKLWNAARFTMMMIDEAEPGADDSPDEPRLIDRWMLSRLEASVRQIESALREYQFSVYAQTMYDLVWRDFCDWYLEAVKPTVKRDPKQRAVLRSTLDCILRLLQPVCPFVTQAIAEYVNEASTEDTPGVSLGRADLLCHAAWPDIAGDLRDEEAETRFDRLRRLIEAIRDVRANQQVHPRRKITLHADAALASEIASGDGLVETIAGLGSVTTDSPERDSLVFVFEAKEHHLSDLADAVDSDAERERLTAKIADLDKSIKTLEGRLNNPGYIEKAPEKLVNESRRQLAALQSERDAARQSLERLG